MSSSASPCVTADCGHETLRPCTAGGRLLCLECFSASFCQVRTSPGTHLRCPGTVVFLAGLGLGWCRQHVWRGLFVTVAHLTQWKSLTIAETLSIASPHAYDRVATLPGDFPLSLVEEVFQTLLPHTHPRGEGQR